MPQLFPNNPRIYFIIHMYFFCNCLSILQTCICNFLIAVRVLTRRQPRPSLFRTHKATGRGFWVVTWWPWPRCPISQWGRTLHSSPSQQGSSSTAHSGRVYWDWHIERSPGSVFNTCYYPRATRCGGDIVTLLWFRVCVCVCVRASGHGPCEHDRDWTIAFLFVKLGRHVNHDERMNPIDFGGQRSKVKVTMDIYGNKLVNMIETKPLCISSLNLADMLTMVRG